MLTDVLPPNFSLSARNPARVHVFTGGHRVLCSLSDLGASSNVTVIIVAIPTAPGSAQLGEREPTRADLNPANNALAVVVPS